MTSVRSQESPPTRRFSSTCPGWSTAYYTERPDPAVPAQRVAFGTSGHRGSSLDDAFNEAHILAITQAICLYRKQQGIDGPLFLGIDTHALSEPALRQRARGAGGQRRRGHGRRRRRLHADAGRSRTRSSPTTAGATRGLADGIVITPSHNPPEDGGFKYNPPHGGPADTHVTAVDRGAGQRAPRRRPARRASGCRSSGRARRPTTHRTTTSTPTSAISPSVVDMEAIRASRLQHRRRSARRRRRGLLGRRSPSATASISRS